MNENELTECFEFVQHLVRQCSPVLLEGFKDCGIVETKTDFRDVVTKYDREIEGILMAGIKEKYPEHRILAEEETSASKTPPTLTDNPTWIIDPIDGTMNFVNGISYIAISVGFTVKKELELAILFNPCHDEFYTARRGQGAFLNGQRIYTNNSDSLKDTLMACPAFFHPKLPETMKQYSQKSLGIRQFGSAALNLAYVARGVFGGFVVRSLKPWDVAAGVLLIQEAGGIVTGLDCRPMDLMKPDIICAGNQSLYRQIFEIEEDVERKRREMKLAE